MASPASRNWTSRPTRNAKELGAAKSTFVVNPDFGYLNSQVPNKHAFRSHLGARAGEQTQIELQELSQVAVEPSNNDFKAGISRLEVNVNFEKENIPLSGTTRPCISEYTSSDLASTGSTSCISYRRAYSPRTQTSTDGRRHVKAEEDYVRVPPQLSKSASLHILQLEAEVALLRREIRDNHEATQRVIQGLQRDLEDMRGTCLAFQKRVDGLRVRVNRAEGHIDEIVGHLPAHYGWRSEVGSDFDPDTTLTEVDDGSQPVDEPWWPDASDVEVKKENDG
ncbi:hypothetical protein B0H13DRAFT_2516502 [Mycena leptocephala]|nr:hypothetical protein B0H13DRAFT_2516502 [Mycena leptocephala]